jgi:hypothetical protein
VELRNRSASCYSNGIRVSWHAAVTIPRHDDAYAEARLDECFQPPRDVERDLFFERALRPVHAGVIASVAGINHHRLQFRGAIPEKRRQRFARDRYRRRRRRRWRNGRCIGVLRLRRERYFDRHAGTFRARGRGHPRRPCARVERNRNRRCLIASSNLLDQPGGCGRRRRIEGISLDANQDASGIECRADEESGSHFDGCARRRTGGIDTDDYPGDADGADNEQTRRAPEVDRRIVDGSQGARDEIDRDEQSPSDASDGRGQRDHAPIDRCHRLIGGRNDRPALVRDRDTADQRVLAHRQLKERRQLVERDEFLAVKESGRYGSAPLARNDR